MKAIDFFCGTGGFSLGAVEAGFQVVGAYDVDPNLTYSHRSNFPQTELFHKDISCLEGAEVTEHFGGDIDLIIGGPPCQGFSMMGRRSIDDPRRSLLSDFFRLVSEVKPTAFVMENVEGLLLGQAKSVLEDAQQQVIEAGYALLAPVVLDASDFGAPTKRRRAFVIGYLPGRSAEMNVQMFKPKCKRRVTVSDALSGLEAAAPFKVANSNFDHHRMPSEQGLSDYAKSRASADLVFTGNQPTKHTQKVIDRFSNVHPGKSDPIGKHHRLKLDGLCPTLRAGTGSEKGSFQSVRPIHPIEDRVITVREAARLQGFPDCHLFHPTKWHSFRQIGNSVSPIIAESILRVLYGSLASNSDL